MDKCNLHMSSLIPKQNISIYTSHHLTHHCSPSPQTRCSITLANLLSPGLFVHHATRLPLLESLQPPASPTTSSLRSPSPSVTGRPLRSTIVQPRVHCPLVSTRTSSSLNFHAALDAESAYHTVRGSCSWRPCLEASWCFGFNDAFLANVEERKRWVHSERGLPLTPVREM